MDIVIGAEALLCVTEPVFGVGQSLSLQTAITKYEFRVKLEKVKMLSVIS